MLHIVSGSVASQKLLDAGIKGDRLAWDDILHEGPVPTFASLEATTKVRAAFLSSWPGVSQSEVLGRLRFRDVIMSNYAIQVEIVIWSDRDLHSQVQMWQVVDYICKFPCKGTKIFFISCDSLVSQLSPEEANQLFEEKTLFTEAQFQEAVALWEAFRQHSPEKLIELYEQGEFAFPFTGEALLRLFEEFPQVHNGLSRSQEHALRMIPEGGTPLEKAFKLFCEAEDLMHMGDLSFVNMIAGLAQGEAAAIDIKGDPLAQIWGTQTSLTLTEIGKGLLDHSMDWMDHTSVKREMGGMCFDDSSTWRWDKALQKVIKK